MLARQCRKKKEKNISLQNVLVATAACNFSTAELQKVARNCSFAHFHFKMCFSPQRRAISTAELLKDTTPSVLIIFTSKCAFHHSGVHFFNIIEIPAPRVPRNRLAPIDCFSSSPAKLPVSYPLIPTFALHHF